MLNLGEARGNHVVPIGRMRKENRGRTEVSPVQTSMFFGSCYLWDQRRADGPVENGGDWTPGFGGNGGGIEDSELLGALGVVVEPDAG